MTRWVSGDDDVFSCVPLHTLSYTHKYICTNTEWTTDLTRDQRAHFEWALLWVAVYKIIIYLTDGRDQLIEQLISPRFDSISSDSEATAKGN